jgi:trans-2,3-dihydro-3-hydroxyanthranilate isomerase
LKPDLVRVGAVLEGTGARFCYFISPERQGRLEVRSRMFFYGGEDPATGSAGCAVSWMARHGVAKSDEQILIY